MDSASGGQREAFPARGRGKSEKMVANAAAPKV
jgi:hypothetical protein